MSRIDQCQTLDLRVLLLLPPQDPQVRHEIITSKRVTTPSMMALQTAPIVLTMPIRQAPMAWKILVIYIYMC